MSNIPTGTQDDPRAPWNHEDEDFYAIPIEASLIVKLKDWICGFESQLIDDEYVRRRLENVIQDSLDLGYDREFEITEIQRLK